MIIKRKLTANYTTIPNAVLLDDRISIEARWCLAYLLSKPHDWEVQINDIRAKAKIGRDKAYALIKELVTAGWIRKEDARTQDGGFDGTTYVVTDELAPDSPLPEKPLADKPLADNPHLSKDLKKPSTKRIQNTENIPKDFFTEFWEAYPARPGNSRKKALEKYKSAIKGGATPQEIMAGLKAYARTVEGADPVYTCMASTWLGQERWKADYGPVVDVSAFNEFTMAFPSHNIGSLVLVENAYAAALRITTHEQIMEGIKKYALLVKQHKSDNKPMSIIAAADWLKFRKWQDMENYEVAYRGMSSEKFLKLKKGASSGG